ncbi:magnesium transporter [Amphritea pacifica]|uniref:Magnesium transporter n=1 Tax=Amphritea pacifica TaxID=2811233 RepID=A0ABS2WBG5_9GAMM|nr:magnesium transporter [Amphritea pacifica]MBN0988812.1 magnesium transporter [Amphritea pacifica]MBN1007733.1 magnesium transporter [Amphritea pacifica]
MNIDNRATDASAITLADMDPAIAASLLAQTTPDNIERALSELPVDVALKIASHLASEADYDDEKGDIPHPLEGLSGTVERLMTEAFGILSPQDTVASALDHIVRTDPSITITYIYVTDEDEKLLGVVAMRDLLLASPGQTLEQIMTQDPFAFTPDVEMPEAVNAALLQRHRLYPVTDEEGTLLGLVYGWRLFEYVATEISAQAGSMVGVDKEERITTPILESFRMRHPWLQINLLTAFAAAFVVGMFEDTIARIVVLAVFLPVLAGQSGNTGCQALAITLRSMTLGELANISVSRVLRKEIILGAMNGFFVGLVAALAMWIYAGISGTENSAILALVVLVAMVGACIGSGIFGVLVPVTLKRFGADPAMASSIFLTTFTDILGMGLMLFLATSLLM